MSDHLDGKRRRWRTRPASRALAAQLNDSVRALVLLCLQKNHDAAEARRLVEEGARGAILDSVRRSLTNSDYVLMEMHPNHPMRGQLTVERAQLRAIVSLLDEAAP